ncbi:hypothetical protein DFA_05800 [Cavenderia fasciculata]|uniref:SCP domain-containing protein n=1 Tax=Cavenderia fasciculata TaxID=261658 RepID=F4PMS2_CACFS|nr:uncharacterized protein DFA_05800 [Cavenderia fasciculata]EGG23666.1 hypothetical protein DFA_05800 [Cavenderia fasciculata]|eukprot:XP_004361517.1 hypothetical protein DFA_05800 [Cavenderia fasciculata]
MKFHFSIILLIVIIIIAVSSGVMGYDPTAKPYEPPKYIFSPHMTREEAAAMSELARNTGWSQVYMPYRGSYAPTNQPHPPTPTPTQFFPQPFPINFHDFVQTNYVNNKREAANRSHLQRNVCLLRMAKAHLADMNIFIGPLVYNDAQVMYKYLDDPSAVELMLSEKFKSVGFAAKYDTTSGNYMWVQIYTDGTCDLDPEGSDYDPIYS